MDTEFIDTREAADILQVADKRVALNIIKREGLAVRRVGQVYLIRRVDVLALAERRGGKVSPGRPKTTPIATP